MKGGRRGRGGAPGRATGFQRPSYYKNGARRAGGATGSGRRRPPTARRAHGSSGQPRRVYVPVTTTGKKRRRTSFSKDTSHQAVLTEFWAAVACNKTHARPSILARALRVPTACASQLGAATVLCHHELRTASTRGYVVASTAPPAQRIQRNLQESKSCARRRGMIPYSALSGRPRGVTILRNVTPDQGCVKKKYKRGL